MKIEIQASDVIRGREFVSMDDETFLVSRNALDGFALVNLTKASHQTMDAEAIARHLNIQGALPRGIHNAIQSMKTSEAQQD
jgi:hypothetical protein